MTVPTQRFGKGALVVLLSTILCGCTQSAADRDREALLLKASQASSTYKQLFDARGGEVDRRRRKSIQAIISKIENQASYELVDTAWHDFLDEIQRTHGIDSSAYHDCLRSAAGFYQRKEKFEEAEKLYRQDIKRLIGDRMETNPSEMVFEKRENAIALCEDLVGLSTILDLEKRSLEALEVRHQAVLLNEKYGLKVDRVQDLFNLARAYNKCHKYDEARHVYKQILELNPDNNWTYWTIAALARLEIICKNYKSSADYFIRAIDMRSKLSDPKSPEFATLMLELARVYLAWGRKDDAIAYFQKSIAFYEQNKLKPDSVYISALDELVIVYAGAKKPGEAKALAEKCVNVTLSDPKLARDSAVNALNVVAAQMLSDGQTAEAEVYYQRALDLAQTSHSGMLKYIALVNYANYCQHNSKWKEARKLYDDALAALDEEHGPNNPENRSPYFQIASEIFSNGDFAHAVTLFQKSLALEEKHFAELKVAAEPDIKVLAQSTTMKEECLYRIGASLTYQHKFQEGDQFFRKGFELVEKDRSIDPAARASLLQAWSLSCWLAGDSAREKEYQSKALQQRHLVRDNVQKRLSETISYVQRKYQKGGNVEPPDVSVAGATRALSAMRDALGRENLYYVAMTKEIANQFGYAGRRDESAALAKIADQEKEYALSQSK